MKFLLIPLPLAIGILAQLAQATAFDPGLMALVGNGVTVVVLAWYVIYDVRTRTPSMLASFTTEQAASRATFSAAIETMRTTFIAEQNATRIAFASEQAAIRSQYDRELSDMRQMLFDNLTAMRKAVHDVKDTAQVLITKRSVAELEQTKAG
jgi:hypothetical protein